jgi:kynurenine formamidase
MASRRDIDIRGTRVIDLSQLIEPSIPTPVGIPGPKIDDLLSQERGDVVNVELVQMSVHASTHCDAPYHFFSDLRSVDQLAPGCLIGPAVVVDLTHLQGSVPIRAQDLLRWESDHLVSIDADDIVLLHTGHSHSWSAGNAGSAYWQNGWPYLTSDAADYLASKPIRAIGVESLDPDWVDLESLATAQFTTHRTFLPRGILIVENLTNLDQIPCPRCQIIALPLKLKGCSGSPVRVVAVV